MKKQLDTKTLKTISGGGSLGLGIGVTLGGGGLGVGVNLSSGKSGKH